jgi:signal transduction histidine kinase/ligand-binding sensor domain-containing protein/DNA-binding response OmpR family regulator
MIQDKIGYMWFGTYSGLDRYDGISFRSYKNIPGDTSSLINAFVQCLLEDKAGNLWIGTTNGLEKFDRSIEKFTHFNLFDEDEANEWNNNIFSICEDQYGYLWLGTGDGLNKFDPATGNFTHFRNDRANINSLVNNVINVILEDSRGDLWIGTGNGLDKYIHETASFIHVWQDSLYREGYYDGGIRNKYKINAMYEDIDGRLWIGTQEGLLELNYDRDKFTLYEYDPENSQSISFYATTSICKEDNISLWIGTWNGLNLFNKSTKKFSRIYHNNKVITSLSHNSIASVFRERSGTLWVSTYGGGVNKVNRTTYPFKQYSEQTWRESKRFSSASIMNMSTARDGSIWLATPTGLLNFNPYQEIFQNYKITQNIRSVKEDKKGNLWIGINNSSGRGLIKFEKNGKIINITDSSDNKFPWLVNQIIEDNDSTLWICTGDQGGIVKVNTHTNRFTIVYKSVTTINTIYKEKTGLIWIGTRENGLLSFDPVKNKITNHFLSNHHNSQSISGNSVITIFPEDDYNLWLGTNMGLNKFNKNKKSFIHFTELDGLPHNWVYLIFKDSKKNLWLSTHKGITKFNPSTKTFSNYDVLHGLIAADRVGVGCQTENGEIYLDSPGGLTRFHPDSILDNHYIPPIVITNVIVVDKSIPLKDTLDLPFSSDHLYIEFAALSYIRPEKNLYAYKLEGIDKDWIHSGTRRSATYTNLNPGEYIFKVKGSNNDGIWNEAGASIRLIIHPPWWQTAWAFTGYGILALLFIYSIRMYDLKRQRLKHQLELEHEHAEKLEEVDRIKSRFFANISHEFRTPLTLIQGPVEQILSNNLNEKINKNANLIKNNANNLLNLINQLLDLSKIDSGRLQLNSARLNITSFIKGITMSFESLAILNSVKLQLNLPSEEIQGCIDSEKLHTILKNLLSNAFKFTPAGGKIEVSAKQNLNDEVEIVVSDNGIGMSDEERKKIFDRFYQVNSNHTLEHGGTGIGLAIAKELVELHKGQISVKSNLNLGTEFKITLPLGCQHLDPSEIVESDDLPLIKKIEINESDLVHTSNKYQDKNVNYSNKNIILIVEDNVDVREFIKDSLGSDYEYCEAENGETGLKKAYDIIPDLIISDIMMPKMNGNDMTRKLKSDQKTSHISIILLTAKSGQENKIKGLETGADEYLIKPFSVKELQIRVCNLLNQRKRLQEKIIRGDLSNIKDEKKLSSIDEKFIIRIKEVIEKHLSEEEFSIEAFAKEIGMSRTQLHRKIKALVGKSASQYVRSIRLNKAKKMIEEKKGNISEIAYSVGFSSPSYFTHCYKEEFGHPPKEIKK